MEGTIALNARVDTHTVTVELTYRRGISDGDPSKGTQLEDDIRNENQ